MVDFAEKVKEICRRNGAKLQQPSAAKWVDQVSAITAADTRHRRKTAGIPAAYWGGLDAPRDTDALSFVRSWLDSGKAYAVMCGTVGTGKSFAGYWAVDNRGGRCVNTYDLCRAGMYGEDHWDELRLAPYLFLDELGPEPKDDKGYWESKLFRLLAGRLDDGRRTLIATNLGKSDLVTRYGSGDMVRLWDRLEANWMGQAFVGPSMRGQP